MGDRSNPIKFGPEWLRNFSTERRTQTTSTVTSSTTFATVAGSAIISTTSSASSTGTSTATLGAAGGGATPNVSAHTATNTGIPVAAGGAASNVSSQSSSNTSQHNPKILLAKLRYGREEMLALYDKETAQAPSDLKYNDLLYKPKEQPPMALNSTFDDELRESMRNNQPPPQATDRGVGRSRSGPAPNEGRGRGRLYHRQLSGGRGQWSTGNPRMLGYSPGPEDQSMSRLWGPVNVRPRSPTRNGTEAEWGSQRVFRSKRMNTPNNWRAQTRDENEEWRLDSRPRSLQDKRDRGWNDRTVDKSWNSNRRPWVGSGQNEESLPEWAVGSAEANPGTFDSSGAFHGYSNDDSSLSRPQESSYSLTRSHTHGSFARSKTTDEVAEKDNSKSTKKFDATEVKFKRVSFKQPLDGDTANDGSTSDTHKAPTTNEEEKASYDSESVSENAETPTNPPKSPDTNKNSENYNSTVYNPAYGEKNSFDALMRSNINLDEGTDDRSNFQSVMIASNNSLRQKHQNIVPSEPNHSSGTSNLTRSYLQMLHHNSNQQSGEEGSSHQPHEVQLVEQICDMTLKDDNKISSTASSIMMNTSTSMASVMSSINSMAQIPSPNMQMLMANSALTKQPMLMNTQSVPAPGLHQLPIVPRMNSNLNPNMGLQLESGNNPIGMRLPMHGLPVPNHSMSNPAMGGTALPPSGIIGFPPSSGVPNTSTDSNSSLFLGQNPNNSIPPNDIPLPGHGAPNNPFPLHAMQQRSNMQPSAYRASLFPNMMQPPPPPPASSTTNLADQWYYEDPKKTIQGPFTPKEMYTWYRAGFFGPSLMVRRAIDTHMRPLGSFGPIVPFAQDMLPPFPFGALESHNMQGPMDSMLNQQQNLAMDVNSLMGNLPSNTNPGLDSMQFPVGRMNNAPFTPQPMEYPWGQPTSSSELMWMQPMNDVRNESRVNNLPPFFWDHQQSIKEMKTEDQILAQIKASQNISIPTTQSSAFFKEPLPITSVANTTDDAFEKATLSLEELQKLIPTEVLPPNMPITEATTVKPEPPLQQVHKTEKDAEPTPVETSGAKSLPVQNKVTSEAKQSKPAKNESEKSVKNKDTNGAKSKNKNKSKEDKKEDADIKNKEDDVVKTEKRSVESSPTKSKKDEKPNKKELEKEKKDWIKEGFTIVKGSEKTSKENKKKSEEAKIAEEAEKKRKEEEKLAAEEEKKKKQVEALKRQQEQLLREQHQRQMESVPKKAPWSIASQTIQATDNEGLTLAEIQRLEREKKLEQMKEQQQMMHIIAQQQAAALAREQEMQAGLGWAKKKLNSSGLQSQTLAEIQAETRKTAAANAAAAAAAQILEETLTPLPTANQVPWGNSTNGGAAASGFWDAQPNQPIKLPEKQPELPKPIEQPKKKKVNTVPIVKKESSPVSDFETWCTGALASWSYKIDVPTFFGFLKDIESPYEVKDYVKCYLGETKDSSDFARQFLEKRSKLLRVGMVTPSDDLCSPAVAVNPRTASGSDNQDAKGKGKKTKKNKMLKVDARILGFSVTAAEDRINVGDIDTV